MRISRIVFVSGLLLVLASSCGPEPQPETKKEEPVPEVKITDTTSFKNDVYGYDNAAGAIGVFDVPEMLVLSILDSADSKDVSSRVVKNFAILEEEMNTVGAEMNGPVGMITYNNDVHNFIFENILFIKRLPKTEPKRCKIVVLEASLMLVYNFYGSYQNLFAAYDKIKRHCEKNDLIQSGPMREFYLTDPAKEKDPQKWLTRIMLPVVSMHKKPGAKK